MMEMGKFSRSISATVWTLYEAHKHTGALIITDCYTQLNTPTLSMDKREGGTYG